MRRNPGSGCQVVEIAVPPERIRRFGEARIGEVGETAADAEAPLRLQRRIPATVCAARSPRMSTFTGLSTRRTRRALI